VYLLCKGLSEGGWEEASCPRSVAECIYYVKAPSTGLLRMGGGFMR
jgi:hypothetical protein